MLRAGPDRSREERRAYRPHSSSPRSTTGLFSIICLQGCECGLTRGLCHRGFRLSMSRDALILIYGILLLLILIPFSSAEEGQEKIDSSLAEIVERGGSEKIPVIVMLRSDEDLASDSMLADKGISVKYRYQIIPGLAGEATGQAIDG